MRALLQRVTAAGVSLVDDAGVETPLATIGPGLVVLICAEPADTDETAQYFARKVANMRMFEDADGKTNLSIQDVGGQALVISQFTLAADWKRGNRPGFSGAADPETAERLYLKFVDFLRVEGVDAATGRFRSHMRVTLTNDGPFTIWMDSD
ncbi:MAG: D-aminoacyl-tRNA deacylase [Alphaproteobacteria bacterium]